MEASGAMTRFQLLVLMAGTWASLGAAHRTDNFVVEAPDAQTARQIGEAAEKCRHDKAVLWVGQPMPRWKKACPLTVRVTMAGPGGATSFQFDQGRILRQNMEVNGPVDRLLASVLPHEVTHTVFAHYFRQPVPRWADEGGSVLSEDLLERRRHDMLTRQILNRGQQIPLRRLFSLKEYPREVMWLYAQGYSMCDYLVKRSDRKTFLSFVAHGMRHGWDSAVQSFYSLRSVEELEAAWLQNLRDTRQQPNQDIQVAQNQKKGPAQGASRPIVRVTAPPVQPLDPEPVVRGAAPSADQLGQRFGQI